MATMIKDLAQVNKDLQEQKERAETVDFKMITFSLGGKDYGVDIMNVKEIAKADKFTYVPNAAAFVRGVYNLRGDIIPIIDLRTFFRLSLVANPDGQENLLILRIEDRVYGTIVDRIDKVVGINTESIQPPHPIFGDINIKFIKGVVEKEGDLYIILDVVRIFSQRKEEEPKPPGPIRESTETAYAAPSQPAGKAPEAGQAPFEDSNFGFVRDSLATLKRFHSSAVNGVWLNRRFSEWADVRSGNEVQLHNAGDADEFLSPFYSPDTGAFWGDDYAYSFKGILPELSSNNIQVWNIGCGKGYETFSLLCILKERYPQGRIKIWANDNDIMAISSAPNMAFDIDSVPGYIKPYMVKGKNGYSFNQQIKDAISFEYHDVLNGNHLPEIDFIVARDFISFLTVQDQDKMIADFAERLKKRGIIVVGRNEQLPEDEWQPIAKDPVSAFARL
jgi:purine-binding chemotaxis protein CheW